MVADDHYGRKDLGAAASFGCGNSILSPYPAIVVPVPSKIGGVNGHDDQVWRAFRYDVVAFWAYVVLCSLIPLNSLQRCSISSKRVSFETVEIALVILKGICLFPVRMSRTVMFRSPAFRHLNTRIGAAIIVPNHSGSSNRCMKFQM